jgi:hypothetical protein
LDGESTTEALDEFVQTLDGRMVVADEYSIAELGSHLGNAEAEDYSDYSQHRESGSRVIQTESRQMVQGRT